MQIRVNKSPLGENRKRYIGIVYIGVKTGELPRAIAISHREETQLAGDTRREVARPWVSISVTFRRPRHKAIIARV